MYFGVTNLVFLDCSPPHRSGSNILHNLLAFLQGSIAGTRPLRSGCTNRSGSATYPWSSLGQHFITRLPRTHLLAPDACCRYVSQAYEIIQYTVFVKIDSSIALCMLAYVHHTSFQPGVHERLHTYAWWPNLPFMFLFHRPLLSTTTSCSRMDFQQQWRT